MTSRTDIRIEHHSGTTAVKLRGDLTVRHVALLRTRLASLDAPAATTVIDLSDATAVDVSAVQLLMAFKRRITSAGHQVPLVPPADPALARLLANTGILHLLTHL